MIKHFLKQLAALTLLSYPFSSWALPLTFEFTGTISDTVLISKIDQTLFTTHPDWNGQQVTGTLTMDLPELAASPYNGPGYSQYSKNVDYPYANWMSFLVKNPDGTFLDISNSEPVTPAPLAEGDDAYTNLAHQSYLYGDSSFYAQRSYNNHLTYPRKHASLSLRATDDNALWLTSSADYDEVMIKPEFANHDNYGYVYHYTDSGIGHEYYFRIDSLKRMEVNVPEPSTLLLLIAGLILIGLKKSTLRPREDV